RNLSLLDGGAVKSPIRTSFFEPTGSVGRIGSVLESSALTQGAAFANIKELASDLEGEDNKNIGYFGSGYISDVPSSLSKLTSQSPFYKKHVVSVSQFNRNDLHVLFGVAQELKNIVDRRGSIPLLAGKVLCSAFYEPSTRTSSSFEAAMLRLGGSVVAIDSITSSIAKGESLGDTVRTLASYGDAIVLRHPEPGSAKIAAKFSPIPVVNAGDGIGEHPTQAFLDAYTIREEMGTINGLTITMVGDLKNGRTVHSLVKLISQYDVKINLVSPASLTLPTDIKEISRKNGVKCFETSSLNEVIGNTDVLYVTRIQKERFTDLSEYEKVLGTYVITNKVMRLAKEHMIVMHPLPRVNEIDPEVDFDQRAAYFRQMRHGLIVRMALLLLIMGRSG
ncbi:UNVERIFIED_CONTAM: dihydroorotate dehydrogenase, partial [Siphonaria sp. JEL0065]